MNTQQNEDKTWTCEFTHNGEKWSVTSVNKKEVEAAALGIRDALRVAEWLARNKQNA